jgi:hypothetical protein
VLSPFWLRTIHGKRLASIALRTAGAAVVAASAAAGVAALARDLRTAYLWAGPSIFTAGEREQMARVRGELADGETIAVFAGASQDDVFRARLWQRGLYPRNPVAVQFEGDPPERLRELRQRFAIRHAVLLGPPRSAPKLRDARDLGSVPGRAGRAAFGELPP